MISKIYWIDEANVGEKRLGIMARPRWNDWLIDEIKWLKIRGIDCLVSLLERSEEWELGLQNEAEICKASGIEFFQFPIQDVNTPKHQTEFIQLVKVLSNRIKDHKTIVIHCRMGIGRASMLAAAIMIYCGHDSINIFETIGQCRKLKVPDTVEQRDWVLSIADKLS